MYHIATNQYLQHLVNLKLQGRTVTNVLLENWPIIEGDKEKLKVFTTEIAGIVSLTNHFKDNLYPQFFDKNPQYPNKSKLKPETLLREINKNLGQVAYTITNSTQFELAYHTSEADETAGSL